MLRLNRWYHNSIEQHLLGLVQGFVKILDAAVVILSLGFYTWGLEMKFAGFRMRRWIAELRIKESRHAQ